MKSTIEILDEVVKRYRCNNFLEFIQDYSRNGEYTDTTMIREIRNAMITYTQQAIEEDRKIVAENARLRNVMDTNDLMDGGYLAVDKNSIFNAPKLELK